MNAPKRFLSSILLALSLVVPAQTPAIAAPANQVSPTISSDLADYPPGATVTLSGAGWQAGESVHIFVNDDLGQSWSLHSNPDPMADGVGAFVYSFQLPYWFVANYSVTAGPGSLGSGSATTTFTDGPLPASVNASTWKTVPSGDWIQGTLNANNSNYKEGETVPFRIEMRSNAVTVAGSPWYAPICRDYLLSGGVYGYTQLMPFNTSRNADPGGTIISTVGAFSGVGLNITQVYDPGASSGTLDGNTFDCGSTQRLVIVKFDAVGTGDLYLLWGGRLSKPGDANPDVTYGHSAGFFPGGSLQMRLASPDKTSGIQPGAIIQLAKLTVTKVVDNGSATPDQWCFTVTGPNSFNSTQCVPGGLSSVDFVGLDTGSYTITESNVAAYAFASGSGTNCTFSGSTATANVTAAAGGATNASCTFHNALQQGTLTVIKHVVNDNGGTAVAGDWSIHVKSGVNEVTGSPQAGSESGTSYTLNAGTYNVSETGDPLGYTFTGFSGDCDSSGNVTLAAGQNKTCTLTNDDQTAHLKLVKVVVTNSGGSAQASDWTLSASGPTPLSGNGPTVEADVNAGAYALSESGGPSGYTTNGYDCGASVTLALGESKTCTITNDDQQAYVTVVKVVHNDYGGTAQPNDFNLTLNGNAVSSGISVPVNPGTHTAGETQLPGYTFNGFSGDCNSSGQVTVALGESKTCTLTNSDQPAYIIVNKVVVNDNGGTALPNDFNLSVDGNAASHGVAVAVTPGTHSVGETLLPGYTFSGFNGDCNSSGQVTVALGQTKTCTLTNNDIAPKLIVIKHVINDNGGTKTAADFTMQVTGNDPSPASFAGGEAPGTTVTLNAGAYSVSEGNVSGYTASYSADCTGSIAIGETKTCTVTNDDQSAHLKLVKVVVNDNGGSAVATDWTLTADGAIDYSDAGGFDLNVNAGTYALSESTGPAGYSAGTFDCGASVTLALGESKTCTIINNDIAPKLHLRKIIINNNGGTADVGDFTLTADGAGSNDLSGTSPVDSGAGLQADTWALSETSVPGYSAGDWTCVGGTQNGSNITLGIGQEATCTITNDDQQATLTLIKVVVNDNGGTAGVSDFPLFINGNAATSGVAVPVNPGNYTASETQLSGYTASGWTGDCAANGTVSIALGQHKTCTITNDDQPAHLKLVKIVSNNDGGTAVATDFTLSAAGPTPISGAGGAESDVNAGQYNLSETSLAGYTASAWSCVGGAQNGASVTLANGESATCTITNSDNAPTLKLVKVVVNDNGGTKAANDWTLSAAAGAPFGGRNFSNAGGSGVFETVFAGKAYDLAESSIAGYSASAWNCDGGSINGSSITLGLGDQVTCTITNDDIAPKLHLRKVVVNDNGGTAVAAAWTLNADGAGSNDLSGSTPVDSSAGLKADTFALSETGGPSGYTASAWSCAGGTQSGSNITLGIGQEATCTITNDDQQATLTLIKVVVNDNGGTAGVSDFPLFINGNSATSGVAVPVNPGNYTASETQLSGYTASGWTGDCAANGTVSIALGQHKTCTITNDDIAPKLHLRKVVVNDNGGTAVATAWTLNADGAGSNALSGATPVDSGAGLKADTFALSETGGPSGYTASAWSCAGGTQSGSSITLGLGEEATCTITNNDIAPKLHLRKVVVNDNGGTATVANFTLTANGAGLNDLSGTSPVDSGAGLQADTWALSETSLYGYTASAWSCTGGTQSASNITVGIGQEATCTITNNDQPGTIIVKKIIKPVGSLTSFSFQTTGTGYAAFSLAGGTENSQVLNAGTYTVKELVPLGWTLTGIGGSTDPNTPYNCTVTGSGGSSGAGDLNTQVATVSLKNGDTVTCVFENTGLGATRTQGFWATHPQLAQIAWFGGTAFGHTFPGVAGVSGIGDKLICGRPIDDLGKVMGGFWSDIAKKSTGAKRSSLDQARMQLLQQLLAAELNASAFGSVPSGGTGMFAAWESALCGTNQTAIKNAQQQAASFNTQGDSSTFTPGTSANSKYARSIANIPFWNIIKP